MKTSILAFLLVALMIPVTAGAQAPDVQPISKGFIEAGLGFGGCSGDCDGVDSGLGFNVSGFYHVMPFIAVGANVRYQLYGVDGGDLNTLAFGLEGRFYLPLNPMLKLYGLGGLGYTTMTMSSDYGDFDDSAIYVQLGGGIEYSLTPLVAVGAQFKYQMNSWDESEGDFDEWFFGATLSFKF